MRHLQTKDKPLIDLTSQPDADWKADMEERLASLEAMVTRLLMQNSEEIN